MTTHAFQTEVTQLLHLMIHSLYSEREIFLRELVSNASDACDKLRFLSLTQPELARGDADYRVDVVPDKDKAILTITDNGLGLTEAEAVEHLGTIAKSGTKAFLQGLGEDQKKNAQLIGQFGVGFYSAFMVADKVVVESRSARAEAADGVRWESAGDGRFSTERIERAQRGTTITLHLKEDAKEFLEPWKLRGLVKRYSDYVTYPVRLPKEAGKAELEQVNAGQPLWTRPKDQITDEQHEAFYRSACRAWDTPASRLHVAVEGALSFTALLYFPGERPIDLFERDRRGLSLYVRRVFVMDDCKDLLPEWLRFVRGVVDSDDLPLNVSREILQGTEVVQKIRKQLVKRILDHLLKLAQSTEAAERKAWDAVEGAFGTVLREGLVTDPGERDRLSRLARWASTWTRATPAEGETRPARTGLEDYVRRMPAGQKAIYFVTAPSEAVAAASPQLEGFRAKGWEVLFLAEPVDEWVVQHLTEFDGRKLVSVARGAADLAEGDAKKALEEQAKTAAPFLAFCREKLGEGIAEVRLTDRLTDSPCCLVGDEHGISPQMEELMRRMGQQAPKASRSLELNPGHPLVQRLQALYGDEAKRGEVGEWVGVLHDQALIAEGGKVADGAGFAKRVQKLLGGVLGS